MPKKRILMGMVICVLMISISLVVITNKSSSQVINKGGTSSDSEISGLFAIMLETEALSGVYEETESSEWPGDGYVFNEELSTCVNGSELSWDNETNSVLVLADSAERCYVYFDVLTFAEYIVNLYTSDGVNGLFYHDADLENGAGDNSYRYAGASADVNNYVCFGTDAETCPYDNLYRIIGLFDDDGDGTYNIKLIKADYATAEQLGDGGDYYESYTYGDSNYKGSNYSNIASYYWNYANYSATGAANSRSYNIWSYSALNNDNLNGDFLTYIGTEWSNLIAFHNWKVGGMSWSSSYTVKQYYDVEVGTDSDATTHSAKIGLMYVSDYGYAASPTHWESTALYYYDDATDDNWMYMGLYEWTISRRSGTTSGTFLVDYTGGVRHNYVNYFDYAVRPSFYLESSVEYVSGDGTYSNPFRIA